MKMFLKRRALLRKMLLSYTIKSKYQKLYSAATVYYADIVREKKIDMNLISAYKAISECIKCNLKCVDLHGLIAVRLHCGLKPRKILSL